MNKILKNKTFWIVLAMIIIFFIIYRNWDIISKFFDLSGNNKNKELEKEADNLSDNRKKQLEQLADNIINDINDTSFSGHSISLYQEANGLSNAELLYFSTYALNKGENIKSKLKTEYFFIWETSTIDELIAKLTSIGQ